MTTPITPIPGSEQKYTPSVKELGEVATRFTYHPPNDDQPSRYVQLRTKAAELAILILQSCPPSRERSSALTKLDETVMHANASIARNE